MLRIKAQKKNNGIINFTTADKNLERINKERTKLNKEEQKKIPFKKKVF